MKRLVVVVFILTFVMGIAPAFAQQSSDYIVVKKSDLPPDVLSKIQFIAQATENLVTTTAHKGNWFFLMSGYSDLVALSHLFVVVGPFQNQTDCEKIRMWAKEQRALVSESWYGGD